MTDCPNCGSEMTTVVESTPGSDKSRDVVVYQTCTICDSDD